MLTGIQHIKAQLPFNDAAWQIQPALCDSFNGSTINTSKWSVEDSMYDGHGIEMMFKRNITVASGHMRIKVDTLKPNRTYSSITYSYQAGSMNSQDTSFKYGYLEMSAKYPTGDYHYWPAFWIWMGNCNYLWYNEIDICENGTTESFNGHEMGTNVWMSHTDTCHRTGHATPNPYTVAGLPKVDSIFHKYAVQWDANNIYWYFDNNLVRHFYDANGDSIPQHHLQLVFDVYVPPSNWYPPNQPHMPVDSFVVDYFNYYQLTGGNTYCSSSLTITDPVSYNRSVYNSINTGGGSNTATFSPTTTGGSYTLRATNYIELDQGTVINPSSNGYFAIEITPCSN